MYSICILYDYEDVPFRFTVQYSLLYSMAIVLILKYRFCNVYYVVVRIRYPGIYRSLFLDLISSFQVIALDAHVRI